MNTSNNNKINILDLPNEILLFIFNKLKTIDVLYSLVDVNKRFNRLIFNSLHIRNLDTTNMVMKSYFNRNFSMDKNILLRIFEKIFPRISHQLNELIIEQYSIEYILFPSNYSQVYSLSLINFQEEILFQYLTNDSILHNLLTQQITDLNVDISYNLESKVSKSLSNIFTLILSVSKKLINLNFCQLFSYQNRRISIYKLPSTGCVSSTLTKLNINVETFNDCLYLVQHLKSLLILIIDVKKILLKRDRNNNNSNSENLPKLKYFSLTSMMFTDIYDNQIIPLLRRMINLKELTLFLAIFKSYSTYIDGIQLHDQILIYMSQINKFTFSINTAVINENIKINLPSNEDIQNSFIRKIYGKVGSYVDYRSEDNIGVSHVYSLPYQFKYFLNLTNFFQDDIFYTVQHLTMHGGRSLEYNLFKSISQCFPLLKELRVINCHPQKNKQYSSILIIFPHLILLDLYEIHVDYAEQLLFDKNTHLPCLLDLCIKYKSLEIITNNFTNNPIRENCAKIKKLHIDKFIQPKNFHEYFPLL